MAIPVKLQVFEGPLDLLLHLIDRNEIDIYDIPIALITDQYLAYVDQLQEMNLDVMSEFLVMAATLLRIKSAMLLPVQKEETAQVQDPRQELVERLTEYKMYRYAAKRLRQLQSEASVMVYGTKRMPTDPVCEDPPPDPADLLDGKTLDQLYAVFLRTLQRAQDKIDPIRSSYGRIEPEEISQAQRTIQIRQMLQKNHRATFADLVGGRTSRVNIVVSFLIVLELMKSGEIRLRQESLFGEILIEAV